MSNDDTILDLIDDISDVNSVNVEEFMEQSEKRQGKGQDNIQSNHQDENNNYAEDDIISISSDDEMINEERGLEVSDMKTVIQTVIITASRTVQMLNGQEVGSHVEIESFFQLKYNVYPYIFASELSAEHYDVLFFSFFPR